ncbi:MAG TPA: oxidoreductase [Rhodospirillaceae bacterium]|nr:2-dehydropantoate 2-reductase [Rhodospirillaceae bacterium]HAA93532.1 oxidoreductase [Rhodospirillaceae bacterium]HAT35002.1 oxidoreductase [Rhodospirillaceae bacterium]
MKICIYGAGAIGGFMGAELAAAGEDVSLIARGPHLEAMQQNGLTLIRDGQSRITHPTATSDPAELGPQDYVIITLKAHSVPGVVDHMQPLLGPDTAVVTAVNGVPWWYFYGQDGAYAGKRLESVDPGNKQWENIGPERAIGCVVYPATEVTEPGVIQHIEGDRFTLGEPDGSRSERIQALSKALIGAGLKAPVRPRIRDEIWIKLWGNLSFNPISALTGETLEGICDDDATVSVVRTMMVEAAEIAEKLGVRLAVDVDKRIAGAKAVGAHKTSMLQDLERGRPMEIDALVGVVQELGQLTETPTPTIDAVLALVKQRARLAGCYWDD